MFIVWGKNVVIFHAEGVYPYWRDLKYVDFDLIDTGRFALEKYCGQKIADHIHGFCE